MIDIASKKSALEKLLQASTEELKSLGIEQPTDKDWVALPEDGAPTEADSNVVADRAEDWAERNAILAEIETRHNNIKRALQKIETGTYGICEISGETIEDDRLEANPAARTCKDHLDEEAQLPL